ncbi:glycoside hydrolase family 43 protein [Longispora albida]|uniref:glycoside hydrolase family 43 protein n=1 Tax=Longispora albida TaxID=203523 RepID=UPI00036658F2|nr:glycoside hydrolase family 43 protein [Longispora albida]
MLISNPVLPGFHPDPAILRAGEDYYLATSTFEWYPGVRLHHSRDLVHWRPLGGILGERRLLDLSGVPDSGGVWAPCLSHAHGLFHLVFTRVDNHTGGWWDAQNYLTTASDPEGPWSDPVPLHARGFDASLFHDEDACWLLSLTADWRPGHNPFGGIQAQRFDCEKQVLTGDVHHIYSGTSAGITEGPHIYRHGGWYYLVTAEGGTSWQHQVTIARSRTVLGPYETDPAGPALTSRDHPGLALQKAGHGSLVETSTGQWYLAHLAGRPITERGRCVLGRETALQPVTWGGDGWPRIGDGTPAVEVPAPSLPAHPWPATPVTDTFADSRLGPDWSTLRRPESPEWIDLGTSGRLRVHGGQSPRGNRSPSLVARRATSLHCALETTMLFTPATPHQFAGVAAYYDTRNWHFAHVHPHEGGRALSVLTCDDGTLTAHSGTAVALPDGEPVQLRVAIDGDRVRFAYGLIPSRQWHELDADCDATILSDEYAGEKNPPDGREGSPAFTGTFLGLWVCDLGADGGYADFTQATYTTQQRSTR